MAPAYLASFETSIHLTTPSKLPPPSSKLKSLQKPSTLQKPMKIKKEPLTPAQKKVAYDNWFITKDKEHKTKTSDRPKVAGDIRDELIAFNTNKSVDANEIKMKHSNKSTTTAAAAATNTRLLLQKSILDKDTSDRVALIERKRQSLQPHIQASNDQMKRERLHYKRVVGGEGLNVGVRKMLGVLEGSPLNVSVSNKTLPVLPSKTRPSTAPVIRKSDDENISNFTASNSPKLKTTQAATMTLPSSSITDIKQKIEYSKTVASLSPSARYIHRHNLKAVEASFGTVKLLRAFVHVDDDSLDVNVGDERGKGWKGVGSGGVFNRPDWDNSVLGFSGFTGRSSKGGGGRRKVVVANDYFDGDSDDDGYDDYDSDYYHSPHSSPSPASRSPKPASTSTSRAEVDKNQESNDGKQGLDQTKSNVDDNDNHVIPVAVAVAEEIHKIPKITPVKKIKQMPIKLEAVKPKPSPSAKIRKVSISAKGKLEKTNEKENVVVKAKPENAKVKAKVNDTAVGVRVAKNEKASVTSAARVERLSDTKQNLNVVIEPSKTSIVVKDDKSKIDETSINTATAKNIEASTLATTTKASETTNPKIESKSNNRIERMSKDKNVKPTTADKEVNEKSLNVIESATKVVANTKSAARIERLSGSPAKSTARIERLSGTPVKSAARIERLSGSPAKSNGRIERLSGSPSKSPLRIERASGTPAKSSGRFERLSNTNARIERLSAATKSRQSAAAKSKVNKYEAPEAAKIIVKPAPSSKLKAEVKVIFDMYITPGSELQVNIPNAMVRLIKSEITKGEYTRDIYDNAQLEILNLMERDSFPRYLKDLGAVDSSNSDSGSSNYSSSGSGNSDQSERFKELLSTEEGVKVFTRHCEKEYSPENIMFWIAINEFKANGGGEGDVNDDEVERVKNEEIKRAEEAAKAKAAEIDLANAERLKSDGIEEDMEAAKVEAEIEKEEIDQKARVEKIEADEMQAKKAAAAAEIERLKAVEIERVGADKIEADKLEAAKAVEIERLKAVEVESLKAEESEADKIEATKAVESERMKATETDRLKAVEIESVKTDKIEADKLEAAKAAEIDRLKAVEIESLEADKLEAAKVVEIENEKAEKLKADEATRAEAEKLKAAEMEIDGADKAELERIEASKIEAEKLKADEATRAEAEKLKAAEIEIDRANIAELERIEASKIEAEKQEATRVAAEKAKAAEIEIERVKASEASERLEIAKLEADQLEVVTAAEIDRVNIDKSAEIDTQELTIIAESSTRIDLIDKDEGVKTVDIYHGDFATDTDAEIVKDVVVNEYDNDFEKVEITEAKGVELITTTTPNNDNNIDEKEVGVIEDDNVVVDNVQIMKEEVIVDEYANDFEEVISKTEKALPTAEDDKNVVEIKTETESENIKPANVEDDNHVDPQNKQPITIKPTFETTSEKSTPTATATDETTVPDPVVDDETNYDIFSPKTAAEIATRGINAQGSTSNVSFASLNSSSSSSSSSSSDADSPRLTMDD